MTKILLCGACGRMGHAVAALAAEKEGVGVVAGVDAFGKSDCSFPVYASPEDVKESADVIVDFSNHAAVSSLCAYALKTGTALVIASTGHTEEELALLRKTAERVPVFYSRNMSVGVYLLGELCKKAAEILGEDFDIEIIEAHHGKKLDAPSGTALTLAEEIKSVKTDAEYVYDRHEKHAARDKREIGIHAIRGGTIVGEHEVLFAGPHERVTLSHSAESREIFAAGALRAAAFLAGKPAGFYSMKDLFASV